MLDHGEAKVLITDTRIRADGRAQRSSCVKTQPAGHRRRRSAGSAAASCSANRLRDVPRARATRTSPGSCPADEWDAIALNYTSGTTGNPKGVVYHHRGAYLNALSQHPRLGHAAPLGVPVDAADVPLQRLVLSVDHGGERRHQRLPAQGRGGGDLRRDPASTG